MKRVAFAISMVTLVAVLITLAIVSYWFWAPIRIAELEAPLPVLNDPIIGDKLLLSIPDKIQQAKVATITMESDSTVIIPKYTLGQSDPRVLQVEIPATIPPGRYRIFLRAVIVINPVKKVERIIASEEFEVKR